MELEEGSDESSTQAVYYVKLAFSNPQDGHAFCVRTSAMARLPTGFLSASKYHRDLHFGHLIESSSTELISIPIPVETRRKLNCQSLDENKKYADIKAMVESEVKIWPALYFHAWPV